MERAITFRRRKRALPEPRRHYGLVWQLYGREYDAAWRATFAAAQRGKRASDGLFRLRRLAAWSDRLA